MGNNMLIYCMNYSDQNSKSNTITHHSSKRQFRESQSENVDDDDEEFVLKPKVLEKNLSKLFQQSNANIKFKKTEDSWRKQEGTISEANENSDEKHFFSEILQEVSDYICVKNYVVQNDYKILTILEKNKKGSVFKARKLGDGKLRALKEIEKSRTNKLSRSGKEFLKKKFEGQCSLLSSLDHPNIMKIYEIYHFNDKVVVVMELLDLTLSQLIKNKKKIQNSFGSMGEWNYCLAVKKIFFQVLKALAYLHDKNIAYLGLTAEKIMMLKIHFSNLKRIVAKLVGFGKAKKNINQMLKVVEYSERRTLGEHNYRIFSPQFLHQKSISLKTDIWDLGMILFEAATGIKIKQATELNPSNSKSSSHMKKHFIQIWKEVNLNHSLWNKCLDLIFKMLDHDYTSRLTAKQCLSHEWFSEQKEERLVNFNANITTQRLAEKSKNSNFANFIKSSVIYQNIDPEEVHEIAQIFGEIDKDHSGFITISEFLQYLKRNSVFENVHHLKKTVESIISRSDRDRSGSVDFHEFVQVICDQKNYMSRKNLLQFFEQLDWDGNGYLSLAELEKSLSKCEYEQIRYYMENIDSDSNGKISQEEFISYCRTIFEDIDEKTMQMLKDTDKKDKSEN